MPSTRKSTWATFPSESKTVVSMLIPLLDRTAPLVGAVIVTVGGWLGSIVTCTGGEIDVAPSSSHTLTRRMKVARLDVVYVNDSTFCVNVATGFAST